MRRFRNNTVCGATPSSLFFALSLSVPVFAHVTVALSVPLCTVTCQSSRQRRKQQKLYLPIHKYLVYIFVMPPSNKLCVRSRVRHSPYERNEDARQSTSPQQPSAIQRFAQNKQQRRLISEARSGDDSDGGSSSESLDENKSEGSIGLPDTEADYFFPALDRYEGGGERSSPHIMLRLIQCVLRPVAPSSKVMLNGCQEAVPGCSGCGNSQWCDGNTYFTQPTLVEKQSGAKWAQGAERKVYCTLCMQKRVGAHGHRDEPDGTENDELCAALSIACQTAITDGHNWDCIASQQRGYRRGRDEDTRWSPVGRSPVW
eukprot:8447764-Pyramimonas_sp.AAC.1